MFQKNNDNMSIHSIEDCNMRFEYFQEMNEIFNKQDKYVAYCISMPCQVTEKY